MTATGKTSPQSNTIYSESLLLLGMVDGVSGDIDSAIKHFNESLSSLPRQPTKDSLTTAANVYGMLSTISLERGDIRKAMEYVSQIGRLAKQHPEVQELFRDYQLERANVLLADGKSAKAESILRSISHDVAEGISIPETIRSTIALSRSVEAQGRNDEAYQMVIKSNCFLNVTRPRKANR